MTSMESYDESVQEVVARETARRKRVFLAFLALLMVPISIGAYALSKAPSETQKIVDEVTPPVTARVGHDVAEHVTKDVVAQTEPLIRSKVSSAIAATVEPRIASAESALSNLQTSVQQTSATVAAASSQISLIPNLQSRLTTLGESVSQTTYAVQNFSTAHDRLRVDIDAQREFAEGLSTDVGRISGRLEKEFATQNQFKELRQEVTNDLETLRALVNKSVQSANASQQTLGAIESRLSRIDGDLKKLAERVANIEDRLQIDHKGSRDQ